MTMCQARAIGLPLMNLVRFKATPILQQLNLEERLLRTSSDNWCIINDGTNASTIVTGMSGKPSDLIELETVLRDRIPVIRRFTGGGTVIVDEGTIFITLICNKDAIPGLQPYPHPIMSWTGQLYGEVFQGIGDFHLRENDYVFGHHKFGGNAQSITKNRWIHHTSFLWDFDVNNMAYLRLPTRAPKYRSVLPIVASLLTFPFHAMVRMAAVSAMPQLLFVAKSAVSKGLAGGHNASYLEELSDHVISSLVQVLAKEQVPDVLIKVLGSLEESLQISRTVPDGRVQEIIDGLKDVLTASMIRTKDRQELKVSNDFDDEELELLQEEDVEEEAIFLQVSNCIGTLAKLQKSAFASYFNELVPFVTPMLDKALTSEEKCVAICTFNDVAEHCGTSAARYYGIFLPFLIEASVDVDADVRQAAVYGLGICAKNGDAELEFFIKEALRALNHVISHQSAFQFENRMATDNAVSALGKICEYRRDCIDATQVIPVWLCHLPIRNDLREAKVLHQLFFSMVARLDPLLLGQSNQNLPKILSVFAEIIIDGGDLASEEMLAAMPGLLQKLRRAMEPAAFAHLWESLPPESRKILYPVLEHS